MGRFGLGAADDARTDAARLLVAVQDLGDAAVRNAQLAGNNAGTDAGRGQFDDLQSNVVGQRSAVDEHAAQLIDTTLAYPKFNTNISHLVSPFCINSYSAAQSAAPDSLPNLKY